MTRPIKTYDFIVALKQPSFTLIDTISQLMIFLSAAVFFYRGSILFTEQKELSLSNPALVFYLISSSCIGWWIYCSMKQKQYGIAYYRFALMICAWGWYLIPSGGIPAFVYLVACVLEKPVKTFPEIAFDEHEIVFKTFPSKKLSWNDITNVVLKDGILTIDQKNNKLYQGEINDSVSKELMDSFNTFCQTQIALSNTSNS